MRLLLICYTACFFFQASNDAVADNMFAWPAGQKMAISLSYDDAIDSQLDNAVPALNKNGLKASFYLTLASTTVSTRLDEWRAAAVEGHELGNHTIYHPCSAALPDRDWVTSYYNIDDYVAEEIVHEVTVANSFLQSIDGRTDRTYTPPCGDIVVSGKNYIPEIRDLFIAIKGFETTEPGFAVTWGAVDVSGQQLIERVESEIARGSKLLNIIFHGVGGDYLTVSADAHAEFLEYLADNQKDYWVDTYIRIMTHIADRQKSE